MLFLFSVPVWLEALSTIGGTIHSTLSRIFIILECVFGALVFIISFAGIFEPTRLRVFLLAAFWFSLLFVLLEIIRVVVATYGHFHRINCFLQHNKVADYQ
jgi:hypothetical protein